MSFNSIVGQAHAVASLKIMISGGRVPSAMLFLGPRHVGKRTTALTLAKALNCRELPEDSCDACPSCRKIDEGVHPDVVVVEPDGQFIKIGQVRAVGEMVTLLPFEAGKRVIIIHQAERMNIEAVNAFLKTLEEPPGDTLIVMCAVDRGQLPQTILSRCLPLTFGLLPQETVRRLMSAGGAEEGEQLDFAVRFAQGRLRPELPAKAAHWMAIREEYLQGMERLDGPGYAEISGKFTKWSASDDWKFLLEWLETWFRDLALLGSDAAGERLINPDCADELNRWQSRFPPAAAEACYRKVLAAKDGLSLNVNKNLALDALWLGIKEIAQTGLGGAP